MNAFSGSLFDGSTHPASLAAGNPAPPSVINHIRHEMGLDKPLYQQYWDLVWNLVRHGNFGYSYVNGTPVRLLLGPPSSLLALDSFSQAAMEAKFALETLGG